MTSGQPSIVVIGVGNEYRSDDGAGIAVARRLRMLFPTGVTVLEESGEGAALIEAWKGATWVIAGGRSSFGRDAGNDSSPRRAGGAGPNRILPLLHSCLQRG